MFQSSIAEEEPEVSLNDSNENVLLVKSIRRRRRLSASASALELTDAGSMAPADFDRIWFLRMRKLPFSRLSLSDDDDDDDDLRSNFVAAAADSDCDRLIFTASGAATSNLRSMRQATAMAGVVIPPPVLSPLVHSDQNNSVAVGGGDGEPSQRLESCGGDGASGSAVEAASGVPLKKSRWRNKAGGLCTLI